MINLSYENTRKLEYLSILFESMPVEELQKLAEGDAVVNKLKGGANASNVIGQLLNEHNSTMIDVINLRSEIMGLRNDIQVLVKAMSDKLYSPPTYDSNFQILKSRYNVY